MCGDQYLVGRGGVHTETMAGPIFYNTPMRPTMHHWKWDLDAAQYPRYPENGTLQGDYNDDNKNAAIEEIERSLAESVLTALNSSGNEQTLDASNNWIQQTTIGPQNNNFHNGVINPSQTFTALSSDQNYNIYGDQLPRPTEMVCKVTAMCPNYFSSQPQNSPAIPVKDEPNSPGVSPRPCSNFSASGHSHTGDISSCGEDFTSFDFGAYLPDQKAASSSSDDAVSNSSEATSTTPKPGARRQRRRYSRDVGLSPAELQRRERRREQNRRAAEKCRVKNKAKNDLTLKEYQNLQSTNTSLQGQVRSLEKQRQDLQDQLDRHMATCPLRQGTISSAGTTSADVPPRQGKP